jgi:hypothetical protein
LTIDIFYRLNTNTQGPAPFLTPRYLSPGTWNLAKPKKKSKVIADTSPGDIYIHRGAIDRSKRQWDRVLVRKGTQREGFILCRRPARIGVPAAQLTEKQRFVLRYFHLYAFGLGMTGFLWGAAVVPAVVPFAASINTRPC